MVVDNIATYNCAAYVVGITDEEFDSPLLSKQTIVDFLKTYNYKLQTSCTSPFLGVDIVVYCHQNPTTRACIKSGADDQFTYSHLTKRVKNVWVSKMGYSNLVTHASPLSLTKNPSEGYGAPSLCFSKITVSEPMEESFPVTGPTADSWTNFVHNRLNYSFLSRDEQELLKAKLAQVPAAFRVKFERNFLEWIRSAIFSVLPLFERGKSGEKFERLIALYKEDPKSFMPLLVEKLSDHELPATLAIYEYLTGSSRVEFASAFLSNNAICRIFAWRWVKAHKVIM